MFVWILGWRSYFAGEFGWAADIYEYPIFLVKALFYGVEVCSDRFIWSLGFEVGSAVVGLFFGDSAIFCKPFLSPAVHQYDVVNSVVS